MSAVDRPAELDHRPAERASLASKEADKLQSPPAVADHPRSERREAQAPGQARHDRRAAGRNSWVYSTSVETCWGRDDGPLQIGSKVWSTRRSSSSRTRKRDDRERARAREPCQPHPPGQQHDQRSTRRRWRNSRARSRASACSPSGFQPLDGSQPAVLRCASCSGRAGLGDSEAPPSMRCEAEGCSSGRVDGISPCHQAKSSNEGMLRSSMSATARRGTCADR